MTAATAKVNGTATVDAFPVDSFRDAAKHLRRPFTAAAVKFKVQSNVGDNGGLIVGYIDARLAVERLNLVCPHLWHDTYEPLGGKHLICRLTVDDITRQDIGEGTGKGLYSDAFKRAAVKFGVGVSLYAMPTTILNVGKGLKQGRNDTRFITDEGERMVRQRYQAWLDAHGTQAFGEPLDHGDLEGAQGDTETEAKAPDPVAPPDPPIGNQDAASLYTLASEAGVLDKLPLAVAHVTGREHHWDDPEDAQVDLALLNRDQASKVVAWVDKKAASNA